jgi:hypothetical protein
MYLFFDPVHERDARIIICTSQARCVAARYAHEAAGRRARVGEREKKPTPQIPADNGNEAQIRTSERRTRRIITVQGIWGSGGLDVENARSSNGRLMQSREKRVTGERLRRDVSVFGIYEGHMGFVPFFAAEKGRGWSVCWSKGLSMLGRPAVDFQSFLFGATSDHAHPPIRPQ